MLKKWVNASIRIKLTVLLLMLSLFPLLCSTIFLANYLTAEIREETHDKQKSLAASNVGYMDYWVRKRIELVQGIIEKNPLLKTGKLDAIKPLLRSFGEIDSEVEYYSYVDANGFSYSPDGGVSQITDRDYFKQARETKKPAISDMIVSRKSGKNVIILNVPILNDKGEFIGAISAVLNSEILSGLTSNIKFGETGFGFLVTSHGTVVTFPDAASIGKKVEEAFTAEQAAAFRSDILVNENGILTVAASGGENIAAYDTVPSTGWKVVTSAPTAEVYEGITNSRLISWILIVVFVVINTLLALFISRANTKPIVLLSQLLERIGTGDLTTRLPVKSKDEIGQLSHNMNTMLTSIGGMIQQAHATAEHVAASSEELNAIADQSVETSNHVAGAIQQVVNGSEAQATAAEQTSKAMEEMAVGVQRIAESSSNVSELSFASAQEAREGNQLVTSAIRQMKSIQDSVGQTASDLAALNELSQKIGNIVEVIADISNQTQLLSLNASIEAARAGEHGRGFAVVANEVKKLAEQAKQSADDIASLVKEVQGSTRAAVTSMNQGVADVGQGSKLITEAGALFQNIYASVRSISEQIQEISAASEQMSAGTEEVSASMTELVTISQASLQNAQEILAASQQQLASMEEISSSSKSLSSMSQELNEELLKFKV
ncbi:methyl-accepting chemotaxis protein [Paenibacillus ehimensis]|uniref:Methyl-accepting chemotaxis protein n=1 Tax=Paenibacillus ehimensis TaxID=79264 RepID=A0ABT8V7G8_9BACL|nr:methyl-accepting chemotaxis protein [Paenibacillus ehimensis]MDO3677382.1 methyl-accepting chemotaxis protein [Paenibacillus ehimensis]MEC0207988.1 methyl-accepting chemotaxis protein [Paenibacillus ehimensis]